MRRRLAAPLLIAASCTAGAAQVAPSPAGQIRLMGAPMQGALLTGQAPAGTVSLSLDGKPVRRAPDGTFLIAFDRDAGPGAVLEATLADGRRIRQPLNVAPRRWRVERVNVAQRPGGPTEAYLRLRETELARIAAARAVQSVSEGWRQRLIWPARGRISGVFGSQRIYRDTPGAFHSGVDVAPGAGAEVVAPTGGVVVLAGPPAFSLEGNLVIVDHGMGLNSAFLHLATTAVREGERVRQGQRIGTVGATGRASGPHLHWSMKWQDARIDPAMLVSSD